MLKSSDDSRRTIKILETSACIEYSLKVSMPYDGRYITVKSDHHDKLAHFVPKCGERWHTPTIENETNYSIQKAVNELVDRRLKKRKGTFLVRRHLRDEAKKRLNQLFKSSLLKDPGTVNISRVVLFYDNLSTTHPGRLEELQIRKRAADISPEPNDLRILAETVELARLNDISLVSGDVHFIEFKDEIFSEFGIHVLDFYDLNKF